MQEFYQDDGTIEYRPGELPPNFEYSFELLPESIQKNFSYKEFFVISCTYYDIQRKYYISSSSNRQDSHVYISISIKNNKILNYEIKPDIYVYSKCMFILSDNADKYILNTENDMLKIPYDRNLELYLDGSNRKYHTSINKHLLDENICSICHDANNLWNICPDCHKCFHQNCIEKWLNINKTCPNCRSDIWKYYTL